MGCVNLKISFLLFFCLYFCAGLNTTNIKPKNYAYLKEIINELRYETWNVSETVCKEKTISLLQNVQNFTLWATWVWDSMDMKPVGSLYGSQYQLGNYDQCLTSCSTYPELRTQYCLANIKIEKKSHERSKKGEKHEMFNSYEVADTYIHTPTGFGQDLNLITWGVCVPASCHPQSVQRFVTKLLKHSHFGTITSEAVINIESCEEPERNQRYSIGDYLFIGLVACLLCATITSSHIYNRIRHSKTNSNYIKITSCFSVTENFKKLTETNDQELKVLNGIRFLTSAMVVLLHQAFFLGGAAVGNGVEIEKLLKQIHTSWLLHSDIVVDTFFMMSGLLLVTICLSMNKITIRNLGKQIVKRYFRLATTLAVTLFFITTMIQFTGSGPLWSKAVNREVNACRKNWWLSLLMLNNYIDRENMCYPVVWSLNCDFHFSIVGTGLVYLYNKSRRAGFLAFAATFIAALISPGVYTALYQFPPLFMLNVAVLRDYRNDFVFNEMYIASHNRLAAYLVGMMYGYVLYVYKPHDLKRNISRSWSIVVTSIGLGLMTGVVRLGTSYYGRKYSRAEAVLYAALSRPLWAFAVGFVVLCCIYGTLPWVSGFLDWAVFRPLSRLTYGVYMVHALLFLSLTFSVRSPIHAGFFTSMIGFLGVLMMSYFISLVLWLCVEAPAANLTNFLLAKR